MKMISVNNCQHVCTHTMYIKFGKRIIHSCFDTITGKPSLCDKENLEFRVPVLDTS